MINWPSFLRFLTGELSLLCSASCLNQDLSDAPLVVLKQGCKKISDIECGNIRFSDTVSFLRALCDDTVTQRFMAVVRLCCVSSLGH